MKNRPHICKMNVFVLPRSGIHAMDNLAEFSRLQYPFPTPEKKTILIMLTLYTAKNRWKKLLRGVI